MKTLIAVSLLCLSGAVYADPSPESLHGGKPSCNWGELTAANTDGLGQHSADPSGDGKGPGDADNPRAGLANVVEPGNLEATCILIRSLLPDA